MSGKLNARQRVDISAPLCYYTHMEKRLTLLIDADDTVLDFANSERDSIILMCKQFSIPHEQEVADEFKRINRKMWDMFELGQITREQIFYTRFAQLFEKFDVVGVDLYAAGDAYRENMVCTKRIIYGARTFLTKASRNHDLYCVTNGITRTQKMRMQASGLGKYFKKLYISEEIGLAKPSREYFQYVLNDIGDISLDSVYIIGDSLTSDVQGGINSGIKTILFNREGKVIKDVRPDYQARSFAELDKLVAKLSRD